MQYPNASTRIISLLIASLSSCILYSHAFSTPQTPSSNPPTTPLELRTYFATCIPGLEPALTRELESINAHNILPMKSGVQFTESPETNPNCEIGLRSLLWLRTPHRIMELLASSDENYEEDRLVTADDLYHFIQSVVHIPSVLGDGQGGMQTLAIKATSGGMLPKELCHSHFTSLTVKNAIVDACRTLRSDGERPNIDIKDPDVPLVLALRGWNSGSYATASVYRCLSGHASLHKRGYREGSAVHKAAMKESLASGLLLESGWDLLVAAAKKDGLGAVLVDPMAGSGTFCIEAALMAADVAPGLIRQRYAEGGKDYIPPAMRWKDYTTTPDTWNALLTEAIQRRKEGMKWLTDPESTCVIQGNEQYRPALELAKSGSAGAGFNEQSITYQNQDCLNYHPPTMIPGRTIVATNPPWGLRLDTDIEESWGSLKQFLRKEVGGCEAWVLCGNKDLTRILRMKQTKRIPIRTGEEDLRWVQYHVFPPKVASPETDVAENKEEEEVFVQ